jgi:hypothetical protein
MTTSKQIVMVALLGVGAPLGAGCGNYSNTDVDFQLALPARDDLAVNAPRP